MKLEQLSNGTKINIPKSNIEYTAPPKTGGELSAHLEVYTLMCPPT